MRNLFSFMALICVAFIGCSDSGDSNGTGEGGGADDTGWYGGGTPDTGSVDDAGAQEDVVAPQDAETDTGGGEDIVVSEDTGTPECASHDDCDDGIECTGDVCTIEGVCTHEMVDGLCFIDEACIAAGQLNVENECEICDPSVSETQWTPRQDVACDDGDPCTAESFCNKEVCEGTPVESCCGNGEVEAGEKCDGDCPTSCISTDACAPEGLMGAAETCDAECVVFPVNQCTNGDGCCPVGCGSVTDDDCESTCGNGIVEAGETCDGDCPMSCPFNESHQLGDCKWVTIENLGTCNAECVYYPITDCADNDYCCPPGCSESEDDDCGEPNNDPECGNGVVEAGELCDGNCPTGCFSSGTCAEFQLIGSAGTCDAECVAGNSPGCVSGDGCCPNGCNSGTDSDCSDTECEIQIDVICGEGNSPSMYQITALDPSYGPDGLAPHGYLFYSADWPNQGLLTNFCLNQTGLMPIYAKSGCIHATYEIGTCVPLEYPKTCEATHCYACP